MAASSHEKQSALAFHVDLTTTGVAATGSKDQLASSHLLKLAGEALWFPEGATDGERRAGIRSAIALLQGIKPSDEVEGMLASQMVATHCAAMECLRRAMVSEEYFHSRERNLRLGTKLLLIYARQMDVLDKHRGKGQQKVTVENVHVEAGAQAIVGNVEAGGQTKARSEQSDDEPKSLPFAPAQTLDMGVSPKVVETKHGN